MTEEEGDMTEQPPLLQTKNQFTTTENTDLVSVLLWIPLATAVERFSGDRDKELRKMGGLRHSWKLISNQELTLSKLNYGE